VAAYLVAETTFEPYGEGVIFVISNINNFGAVMAAAVFGDFFLSVIIGYRADLFSAGAEGAEKTFYGGACYCRGNGKGRGREGRRGNSELLANRAVLFDKVSLLLLGQ
jgi:hypothetical protein